MAVVLSIFFTILALVITWWYTKLFKLNRYLGKFPGPLPLPLIGHAHYIGCPAGNMENLIMDIEIMESSKGIPLAMANGCQYRFKGRKAEKCRGTLIPKDIIPVAMKFREKYGRIVRVILGIRPRLFITDYKVAEFLLGSTTILEKSYEYKYLHPWLGTGLLTSSGAQWRRQRKLITPTFHFQILEHFVDIFESQTDVLVQKLKKEIGGKGFDVFPYVSLCALDIICEAAMGTLVNAQINSDSEYVRNVHEMCRIAVDRAFSPIKMWDILYPLSKDYKKQKKGLSVLHGYTDYVIMKRRKELISDPGNDMAKDEDDVGIKKRMAFLDLLLQSNIDGQPLPNEIIRQEVDTFMFEGHDTTTSAISFTLYLLSRHPEVQDKVVEELRTLLGGDKNRSPTYQNLQDMKYLEMVIKESLRLYPSIPAISRILEEDVEFDGGILPKGLSMTVFAYGVHRDPDVFPDPEVFNPERFSPENSAGRSPFSYIPFSAGPRNCIGQKFAMLEMKSTVAKILRNFELLPVREHEAQVTLETILKSTNGLFVRLQTRDF